MIKLRLLCASALLALVGGVFISAVSPAAAAPAAQANLLNNPGFEGGYSSGVDTQVANGWAPWHENTWDGPPSPKPTCPPCNYALRPKWSAETVSTPLIQQGAASQHVGNQYDPWHGGVFQTVAVPAGTKVRFTAFIRVRASNEQYPEPSYSNFNSNAQVGIDPNGGGVWNSGMSWSGTINPHDAWQFVSIEGTVGASGKVTLYIGVNWKGFSAAHLDAWFDNASLVVVEQGASPTPGGPTTKPSAPPAPVITPFPTPTPGQDGRIIYIVKPGDSMWHIAAVAGLTVEQLKALNNLNTTVVSVGQQLLLGTVTAPSTPIPTATLQGGGGAETPTPQATEISQNPPPAASTGDVCYLLYEDVNGNGLRDPGEGSVAGGQFILSNANGQPVEAFTTTADTATHCSRDLAVGGYNIAATLPSGYNPTTNVNVPLSLDAGAIVSLEFGAQKSATGGNDTGDNGGAATGSNTRLRTALFGAAGVVFLLLAAGLAGFLFISRRGG